MILLSKLVITLVFALLLLFFLYLIRKDRLISYREQQFMQREKRLKAIPGSARDAIIVIDSGGRVAYWNPAAEKLTGYSKEEALGQNLHDLIAPPKYHPAHHAAFPRFVKTGEGEAVGKTLELELLHKSGEEIPVELSIAATEASDGWNAIGIIRDIRERKAQERKLKEAKEEAEELNIHLEKQTAIARDMAAEADMANAAKTMFLANMGHELRTPLNGVMGMSELLLDSGLDEKQCSYAEAILESGKILLSSINDIIDYSNLETGNFELSRLPFEIRDIVEELEKKFRPRAEEKGLVFSSSLDAPLPSTLVGDPKRLRQILFSLLDNAVKFTAEGSVHFELRKEEEGERSVRLLSSIRDTGIGIPDDQLDTLYEGFTQLDESSTREHGGAGLGLSLSKRLVDMMGGELEVESKEGLGTEFRVRLTLELEYS